MLSSARLRRQAGMSLVELMVGVTVGLFVVAGAGMLAANQLTSNRKLLLETQLQQDMRSSVDIITRELRRASFSLGAETWVWSPHTGSSPPIYQTIDNPTTNEVGFNYDRGPGEVSAAIAFNFGFRYEPTYHVLQTRLSTAGWQDLTDRRTVKVTAFNITDASTPATKLTCPKVCADGTDACWPTHQVRQYLVTMTAEAVSDPAVVRTLSTVVRVRNDIVRYNDALNPTQLCPA